MWSDRVPNPGHRTYESGALPTALRGPTMKSRLLLKIIPLPAGLKIGSAISTGKFLAYGATGAHALVLF